MSSQPAGFRVAIVGGGLTGLAAAHRWSELATAQQVPVEVTLFEASSRLGGLVGTVEQDGYLIDTGADSFITNKPGALELCQRLGLTERLQRTEPRYRGALVLSRGKPVPVPEGFQLLSPSALWPVMTSPILSSWGKLRLACEYFIPARQGGGDETLASFVRRRFGSEALDRLVQPLVGGIYTSDPERLSLAATLPRFLEMERQHGSLIRAARKPAADARSEDRTSGGARYGLFVGLRGGISELVDTLAERVRQHCSMRLQIRVKDISSCVPEAPGTSEVQARPQYRLRLVDDTEELFDAVQVCTSTYVAAGLLRQLAPELATALEEIEYASSAIVVTGHRLQDVAHPLNSFGLVIPHREKRKILAVSFSSRKFPNRAPEGKVLLRTFVGGAMQPELYNLSDDALLQTVHEELRDTLGVSGTSELNRIVRYPRAMPQYTLGHLERVAHIETLTAKLPGLELSGNAFRGVGVPDAIFSGEQAAERLFAEFRTPLPR